MQTRMNRKVELRWWKTGGWQELQDFENHEVKNHRNYGDISIKVKWELCKKGVRWERKWRKKTGGKKR